MNKAVKRIRYRMSYAKGYLKENGVRRTAYRGVNFLLRRKAYEVPYYRYELGEQRRRSFEHGPVITLVMPLDSGDPTLLRRSVRSLRRQTYGRWELVLVDGVSQADGSAQALCHRMGEKDSRVRYAARHGACGLTDCLNAGLELATGTHVGLMHAGDCLHPSALYAVADAVCERGADLVYTDDCDYRDKPGDGRSPRLKPDFAPDTLRGSNYIGNLMVFVRALQPDIGELRCSTEKGWRYDLALRVSERAKRIVHIPKVLYFGRERPAGDDGAISREEKAALAGHLERVGLDGEVQDTGIPSVYRVRCALRGEPLVSILIPTCEHLDELRRCVDSIVERTSYPNYEIILIENNSQSGEVFRYYEEVRKAHANVRVVQWEGGFNYPAINNFGARHASGEYLLLLNNDTEVITPDWLQEMLMFSQRPDVGAVDAMLYYPDDTIQHAGVTVGIRGSADHIYRHFKRRTPGHLNRLVSVQNVSVVTAACLMVRRAVWDECGGMSEAYSVAFNDVDFCLRLRRAGYLNLWTPFAELYHHESRSRGREDTPQKRERFNREVKLLKETWGREIDEIDPYYNPNLTTERVDYSLR